MSSFPRVLVTAALLLAVVSLPGSASALHDPCLDPLDGPTPIGIINCGYIRPGSTVETNRGFCTLNFVFTGGDGHRYMGTAGHCFLGNAAQDTVYADGPVAEVGGRRIGQAAYAVLWGRRDFALIRLDAGAPVGPAMKHFGGPTGIYTGHAVEPLILHHYGRTSATGILTGGRTGVAITTLNPETVNMFGTGVWGDSGSGVITDEGLAVGVLVTLGAGGTGTNGISRLDNQLPYAAQALGTTLQLEAAALA